MIIHIKDKKIILDKKWSGDVKTKWSPPEGLYAEGSASEIASKTLSGHKGDVGSAIKSITFFINRAGKNLSSERKKVLEKAKETLQKKNEK